jgi:hypothetical protein
VILAVLALRRKDRSNALGCALALGWVAISAVPAVLSIDRIHALRTVLMIPGVFLLAAVGAESVSASLRNRVPGRIHTALIAVAIAVVCWEPVQSYFFDWAENPNVATTFQAWMVDSARQINELPLTEPKYIAVPKNRDPVAEGIPLFLQPIAYLTGTYTAAGRQRMNLQYIVERPDDPAGPGQFCRSVREQHAGAKVLCVTFSMAPR